MVFSHEGHSRKQLWQWGSFFGWIVTISHVILPWCKETPCNHWPSTKRSTFSCEGHLQVWCWQIGECIIYRIDCNCFLMIQLLDCKSPNLRNNHNYRDNCNGLCELWVAHATEIQHVGWATSSVTSEMQLQQVKEINRNMQLKALQITSAIKNISNRLRWWWLQRSVKSVLILGLRNKSTINLSFVEWGWQKLLAAHCNEALLKTQMQWCSPSLVKMLSLVKKLGNQSVIISSYW